MELLPALQMLPGVSTREASTAGSAELPARDPQPSETQATRGTETSNRGPCRVPAAPHLKGGDSVEQQEFGRILGEEEEPLVSVPGRSAPAASHSCCQQTAPLFGQWARTGVIQEVLPLHMFGQVITPLESSPSALAGSAVTNDHRLGGLNNKHFSQFWKLGSLRSMCWQFLFLSLVFR